MRAVLALVLSLLSTAAHAQDFEAYKAAYDTFSSCDFHLAARAWGVDDREGSLRIQRAVQAGEGATVRTLIDGYAPSVTPTGSEVCPYWEPGLSYQDAEALATHWGLGSPEDAKAQVEAKLIHHQEDILAQDLKAARMAADDALAMRAAFDAKREIFLASYDWCDAEVLAVVWGTDSDDAKAHGGDLIQSGKDKLIVKALKKGKKVPRPPECTQ